MYTRARSRTHTHTRTHTNTHARTYTRTHTHTDTYTHTHQQTKQKSCQQLHFLSEHAISQYDYLALNQPRVKSDRPINQPRLPVMYSQE